MQDQQLHDRETTGKFATTVDFGPVMCRLAVDEWGPPDQQHPYEWRWGSGGGRKIDPVEGTWKDFTSGEEGGGALDFVIRINSLADKAAAMQWLIEHGYVQAELFRSQDDYAKMRSDRIEQRQRRDAAAAEKTERARTIWQAAEPVSDVTRAEVLVADYLRTRGLSLVPMTARVLPPQASMQLGVSGAPGYVGIVWGYEDRHGNIAAVDVVTLHKDGHKANRLTYGSPPRGGSILLNRSVEASPLLVGEGVETVLSGIQATGLTGFACGSAGRLGDFVPPFEVAEIIIAVDNDPAGFDALNKLAPRLIAEGIRVRFVHYDGVKGYDLNDAWRHGRDLAADIAQAPLYEAAPDGDATTDLRLSPSMIEFVALDLPPVEALIAPLVYAGGSTTLHGPTGATKTRFAMSVCYAVATGGFFCEWSSRHPRNVLYFDGELRPQLLQKWLRDLGEPVGALRVLSRDDTLARHGIDFTLSNERCRRDFFELVQASRAELVCIDSRWAGFDIDNLDAENTQAPVVAAVLRDLRLMNIAVLLIDHDNKQGTISGYTTKTRPDDVVLHLVPGRSRDDRVTRVALKFEKYRHGPPLPSRDLSFFVDDRGRAVWQDHGDLVGDDGAGPKRRKSRSEDGTWKRDRDG